MLTKIYPTTVEIEDGKSVYIESVSNGVAVFQVMGETSIRGCAVAGETPEAVGAEIAAYILNPPARIPKVPKSIRNAQLRQRLETMGLLEQVQTAVDAAGGVAKIRWEYEVGVNRDDALVAAIGTVLSLTSEQVDDIFREARKIK